MPISETVEKDYLIYLRLNTNHQHSVVGFLLPKNRTNERRAEMERLTEWYDADNRPDGESDVWVRNHDYTMAAERLAEYEDTGLTPPEIMELKERDTARSPIDIDEDYGFFTCSSCGEAIYASDDFKSHKFCLNCGQRIRWEE